MRRIIGLILAGVAGFLLCTAVLLMVYAPGKVLLTPLNVNSVTHLQGNGRVLPTGTSGPIKAVNKTVTDSKASDDRVAVFDTFTCLMSGTTGPDCVDDKDPQKRLISATTDRFAADRSTAMAVNDKKYTDQTDTPRTGLVNKWPFNAEKKTYPYWDPTVGKAVDAVFKGEENLQGLTVYRYAVDIPETTVDLAAGVKGTYQDQKEMWVDPLTGAPVNQTEKQVRKLADGRPVLDIDLAFTDDQVAANVKDAKANASKLGIILNGPWYAAPIGILAGIGAFILLFGRRREGGRDDRRDESPGTEDGHSLLDDLPDDTRRLRPYEA